MSKQRFQEVGPRALLGLLILLIPAAGGCSIAGTSQATSLADMDPIELIYTDFAPEDSVPGQAVKAFQKQVTAETNGKVTFTNHFSASLMPGEEALEGVSSGIASMGVIGTSYFPNELPLSNLILDMGSAHTPDFPHNLLQTSAATAEAFMTDVVEAEYAENGLKVLTGSVSAAAYDLLCTDPVESLEDASGIRVRTSSEVWADEATQLGMVSVPLPAGELFEGLQRGVIDCAILLPTGHMSLGLWEVANHYTPASFSGYNGSVLAINDEVWKSLPEDVQEIFQNATFTYYRTWVESVAESFQRWAFEGPDSHGVVFHDPAQLNEVLIAYQKEKMSGLGDSKRGATDEGRGLIKTYESSLNGWLDVIVSDLGLEPRHDSSQLRESFESSQDLDLDPYFERVRDEVFSN